MDILTHGMCGTALASPLFITQPEAAIAMIAGATLPDLDVYGRVFGKNGFFRWHRTITHSIVGTLIFSTIVFLSIAIFKGNNPWPLAAWCSLAFGVGMISHILLDYTNSYPIGIFWPKLKNRYCNHSIFFIDIPYTIICVTAVLIMGMWIFVYPGHIEKIVFVCPCFVTVSVLYIGLKIYLHQKAIRQATRRFGDGPTTASIYMIPDAIFPWWFYGAIAKHSGQTVRLFRMSLWKASCHNEEIVATLDQEYAELLETLEEYQLMKKLLPLYRVTSATVDGDGNLKLQCRELAIRHYWGTFGQLEVTFDPSRQTVLQKVFHV